ncbi:MAG: hypothetical protein ABR887_04425 [Methanoregulaceae archaeon]|jgi:hypothetical protein
MISLDHSNIHQEIQQYLKKINSIEFPERRGNNIEYMLSLKRGIIHKGPYPDVSIFEASNRIFSDIVILFAIRQILLNPQLGSIRLPFDQYEVRLGAENGFDIEAIKGDEKLVGEAFNVAQSFFPDKKRKMKAKLEKETTCDYKILIFNADAVLNPDYYRQISTKSMIYLPVDWQKGIADVMRRIR